MFIFIKSLTGKTLSLEVQPNTKIKEIKIKIQERENLPIHQQRIVHAGKDLDDDNDLAFYKIGNETILHLIIKKSSSHMDKLSMGEQREMKVAQSSVMSKYYNCSVGLNDELQQYQDSESKFDKHSNPQGAEFDLGKDGEFKEFNILIGCFDSQCILNDADIALKKKGFGVTIVRDMQSFIQGLNDARIHVAWIISGTPTSVIPTLSKDFIQACMKFHQRGGGLAIWGDNDPYFGHANILLPVILNTPGIQLIGNTPGGKPLMVGKSNQKGCFGPHIITTGIIKLFEGITICYPNKLGPLKVLATSSDGFPAVCYADNESLKSDTCGRILVDCGWTKMYCSWKEAGTARYISNATIWLLGLEHKLAEEETLPEKKGQEKN